MVSGFRMGSTVEKVEVSGVVVRGHRVASGNAEDSPYPAGTIALQTPFFRARGVDVGRFFPGTINVSISPQQVSEIRPKVTLDRVQWVSDVPPETFSFLDCVLNFETVCYHGLVYYPHPETKVRHFQSKSIIEVLMPKVPSLTYGSRVVLFLDSSEISFA